LVAHSLDFPFDQEASTSGFEFVGLMPARAPLSKPNRGPHPITARAFGPFDNAASPRGCRRPTKPREVHGFKPRRKEHHMSKSNNRPSHRVYAVSKNGERNFWQPIGAAWPHSDGDGFNVKLEYLPLNAAEIVIRKPKAEAELADAAAGEPA
jgi:hypothetical protein